NQARAEALSKCIKVAVSRLAAGERKPFPTVEEAERFEFRPGDEIAVARFSKGAVIGDEAKVKAGLDALVERTGAAELMIATMVPDPAERIASYERIARAWKLPLPSSGEATNGTASVQGS